MIGSLAPWYGSKRRLATTIIEELGEHHSYFEPFCGSMAVLMAKPRSKIEVVNDLHGDLINLAVVLASPRWRTLHSRAHRTLFCESIFEASCNTLAEDFEPPGSPELVTTEHIDRAYHFLVAAWFGQAGFAGTSGGRSLYFAVRYTGGGISALQWVSVVRSLPLWHRRLAGVTITRRDGFEMLSKVPDEEGVCVFADPPYIKKSDKYLHDFAADDHQRLAEALARFRHTRCVVSYYDDPRLDGLYPGWHKRIIPVVKSIANASRGSAKQMAEEVLLVNRPGRFSSQARPRQDRIERQRLLFGA